METGFNSIFLYFDIIPSFIVCIFNLLDLRVNENHTLPAFSCVLFGSAHYDYVESL